MAQTSANGSGVTCGETSFNKISMGTVMTERASGLKLRRISGELHVQPVTTSNSKLSLKDRVSDGSSTASVAFLFKYYGCKLLKMLYLFVPLDQVNLKGWSCWQTKENTFSALSPRPLRLCGKENRIHRRGAETTQRNGNCLTVAIC